jgi:hypothetical protein
VYYRITTRETEGSDELAQRPNAYERRSAQARALSRWIASHAASERKGRFFVSESANCIQNSRFETNYICLSNTSTSCSALPSAFLPSYVSFRLIPSAAITTCTVIITVPSFLSVATRWWDDIRLIETVSA